MTQKETDLIFEITITIFQTEWFKEKQRTREEVQDWVRQQLAIHGIYTIPVGSSWGRLVSKEVYQNYLSNIT